MSTDTTKQIQNQKQKTQTLVAFTGKPLRKLVYYQILPEGLLIYLKGFKI